MLRVLTATLVAVFTINLPQQYASVDDFIAAQMTAQHIPGMAFAVVRNGQIVGSGARGLANIELNVPATDATEFAIASMSKSVTASAVLLLVQDGLLRLDDPVRKYLADVPASWDAMTVRQLLSHTSGVKDHFGDFPNYPKLSLDRHLSYTNQEYVKAHIDAALNFAPGAEWAYSGGGYVILGAIIEKITGHPYGDYLRDRIFTPLGMTHTHIINVADIIPNRASGYWFKDGRVRNGDYTAQAHLGGPDVGVITTATDFAKWMIALNGSGPWTEASRSAMWTPARLNDGRDAVSYPAAMGWGLGFLVGTYRGYRMVGHGGTLSTGFTSTFLMIPERGMTVVVLTNQWDAAPVPIARGLLGRYDGQLVPVNEMRAGTDSDPGETDRVRRFMIGILHGSDVSTLATPGLLRHISAMSHPSAGASVPEPEFTFLSRTTVARPLELFGSSITRMAFYKMHTDREDRWLTLLFSADGRIGAYEGY